jgi:hypothetical protein
MKGGGMVTYRELPLRSQFRVFWGFLWRLLVTTVCSMFGGGIAGGIVGFLFALLNDVLGFGLSRNALQTGAQVLGSVAGGCVGLVLYWVYVKWIFRATLGGYSLRLVSAAKDGI